MSTEAFSQETKKPTSLKLLAGNEVYFFKFEDKISDQNPQGRKQKLEYKYRPVHTTNVTATLDLLKYFTLSGTYGGGALSLTQNQSDTKNLPSNAPSWMKENKTSLYAMSLAFFGFTFSSSYYQFNSGRVDVIDVSSDPEGEEGKRTSSFNSNLEFRDSEIAFGIGKIYEFFSDEPYSDVIRYGLLPLNIAYIHSEATLPIIPYFFYKEGGQKYFAEGDVQQAVIKNSMLGFGWNWKYADLYNYLGHSEISLTDQNKQKKNLQTDGWITKFRLRYEWESKGEGMKYIVGPYGQMTRYDFNDPYVGKFTSVGGELFVYQLGLNLGIKL